MSAQLIEEVTEGIDVSRRPVVLYDGAIKLVISLRESSHFIALYLLGHRLLTKPRTSRTEISISHLGPINICWIPV